MRVAPPSLSRYSVAMGMGPADLLAAEKRIRPLPAWRPVEDSGKIRWKAPLMIGGAVVEGLTLHARCIASEPGHDVSFVLEQALAGQSSVRIDRIDWKPIHEHNNKGIGPEELRFITIKDSHRHNYHENLTKAGILRLHNLPIARPLDIILPSFQSLVDFVAETYNIEDLKFLTPPPWTDDLFGTQ